MYTSLQSFSSDVTNLLAELPYGEIKRAVDLITTIDSQSGRIFVIGNGTSFALADIFVSDLHKTVSVPKHGGPSKHFQANRIPSTGAELTAWANDCGYETVFEYALKNYLPVAEDLLIAISCSGNSKNIINAVAYARSLEVPIIGLTGCTGGLLRDMSDVRLHLQTEQGTNELIEVVHMCILKMIVRSLQSEYESY